MTLGWAPPSGVAPASYIVEAGSAPGASTIGRFAVSGSGVSGVLGGGTYYVRVRAVVGGVEGQASSEIVLTIPSTSTAPASPDQLGVSVNSGVVTIQWRAAGGNAESYVIEAGTSPGQANLAAFDTGVLDTTFSAPVSAGTYYVRVRARNQFGVSGVSNEVVVTVP